MSYHRPNNDGKGEWYLVLLILTGMLFGLAYAENKGLRKAPTNKSELCSCVIHVDSVPKPITEGV